MNDILEAESARPKDLGAPPVFRQERVAPSTPPEVSGSRET